MKYTDDELSKLFKKYAETKDPVIRDTIIEHFLYLAKAVAAKFSGRGVDFDDLFQVASLAMLKSLERYDPECGIKFTTYVTPCMIGEIKNYFRDKTRAIHLSRRDSEQLVTLSEILSRPKTEENDTPQAIAKIMGVSVERVLELMEMKRAVSVSSLDAVADEDDDDSASIGKFVGGNDSGFDRAVNRDFIEKALKKLDENERKVIYLRFWKNLSQKQTAEKMGVSQMTVSRLERKAVDKLKTDYFSD